MTTELVPFNFHGDEILCIQDEHGIWVAITPVCAALGIDSKSQRAKLQTKTWVSGALITSQLPGSTQSREVYCIDLDSLPMWLATIEPSRVRKDLRPKLEDFQRECARALRDRFLGAPAAPANTMVPSGLTAADISTMIAQSIACAVPEIVRQVALQVPTRNGLLGRTRADEVRSALRQHADVIARGYDHRSREWKRARMRQENRLRHHVGYLRGAWDDCPILPGIVESGVKFLTRDLDLYDRRPRGTQLTLTDRSQGQA